MLKRIFSGQSDTILLRFREVIRNDSSGRFPYDEIVRSCVGDPVKNYSFENEFIEGLLLSPYQSPACTLVLQLLYPDKAIQFGKAVAQDHMHPKTIFEDKAKLAQLNLSDDDRKFFLENYNTVLNLQLLGTQENGSGGKGDAPLQEWASQNHVPNGALFVDEDTSLAMKDFRSFIEARKRNLKASLRQILG